MMKLSDPPTVAELLRQNLNLRTALARLLDDWQLDTVIVGEWMIYRTIAEAGAEHLADVIPLTDDMEME